MFHPCAHLGWRTDTTPMMRHPEKEARTLGWGQAGTVSSSCRGAPMKPDHMTGQTMGVPNLSHTGGVL